MPRIPIEQKSPADVIAAMRRRLERWELEHLRALVAQLAMQLEEERAAHERTRECLESAESFGDFWKDRFDDLAADLMADGEQIGITRDGQIGIVAQPAKA